MIPVSPAAKFVAVVVVCNMIMISEQENKPTVFLLSHPPLANQKSATENYRHADISVQ